LRLDLIDLRQVIKKSSANRLIDAWRVRKIKDLVGAVMKLDALVT